MAAEASAAERAARIGPVPILLALAAGLALGIVGMGTGWGEPFGRLTAPVGAMWLDGLKMTIVPLVVSLLMTGIIKAAAAARAGTLALRSVLTFLAILWASSIMAALVEPLLLDLWPMPGAAADALRASSAATAPAAATPGFGDFLRSFVPANLFSAAAADAVLPLTLFTTVFAFAVLQLEDAKRDMLAGFFEALGEAMLVVIGWVLRLAPIGVFALAYGIAAQTGVAALGALAHYVVILSALGIVVMLAGYALAVLGGGVRLLTFARAVLPAQAVAISTQSSLASLPAMLGSCSALGIPAARADMILPLAVAMFRATGPAMNLGVALYVAHWYGIEPSWMQIAAGIAIAATTTLGAVSLPGQLSFISSIAPIALAMGVPVEPLALLIAVESLPDIFRTLGNVTMDVAVVATIDRRAGSGEPVQVG